MIKSFLYILLILLMGTGAVDSEIPLPEKKQNETGKMMKEERKVWTYEGTSDTEKLIYTQGYEMSRTYETEDPAVIRDCVEALKGMTIEGETELCATDSDDILSFVMEDGSSYTVSFEAGILVRDGKRYTVTGFAQVSGILRELG